MKRFLIFLAFTLSLLALVSCGGEQNCEHSFISSVTKEPNCTEGGEKVYACINCDYSYREVLAATGHSYTEEVTQPTCTEDGYTTYTCHCGNSYVSDHTDALGHDYINHEEKPATCYESGWEAYQTCTRCDFTTYEEIAALGHDYVDHEGKPATCYEGGWQAYQTCSRCDFDSYVELPSGHIIENGLCTRCKLPESTPGLKFEKNEDGTYTVTGMGNCQETSISIGIYKDSYVTSIDYEAFRSCAYLTNVTIGDSVKSIAENAFQNCIKLKSVIIGNGVTNIGSYSFNYCTSLTHVTIGNSVTSIGHWAFSECKSLTRALIPNSVTSIGEGAFRDCTRLAGVTIGDNVTSIGHDAFYNCTSLTRVDITDISNWCEISFNRWYANPLYYADNLFLNGELVTELVIPDSVTSIGAYAFCGCDSLKSVTFENPDGWWYTEDSSATSGTSITGLSDASLAAKYLTSTYYKYYWRRG